jgi:ACR3 family arsenite efflux pump ArsB
LRLLPTSLVQYHIIYPVVMWTLAWLPPGYLDRERAFADLGLAPDDSPDS